MADTSLGKLYHARLRAQRQIAKQEPQLDGYRRMAADIAHRAVIEGARNPEPGVLVPLAQTGAPHSLLGPPRLHLGGPFFFPVAVTG